MSMMARPASEMAHASPPRRHTPAMVLATTSSLATAVGPVVLRRTNHTNSDTVVAMKNAVRHMPGVKACISGLKVAAYDSVG